MGTVGVGTKSILGDPGAVSQVERNGATKVFKYGRKSPWVLTLTELFPKIQAGAGSWLGTENALYYLPNQRTVSPELFSWVRKRRLLPCHTCPVRSPSFSKQGKLLFPTFQTRNKELPMSQKNVWDTISRSDSNCPENIPSFWPITTYCASGFF